MPALPPGDRLVRLSASDSAGAVALSTEAHWNQTAADWHMMLTLGAGFGVRAADGQLVASAVLLPYARDIAWISMVLVTRARRRRGLATLLMETLIREAEARGLTAFLDATPEGAPVYAALGFTPVFALTRWRAPTAPVGIEPGTHVEAVPATLPDPLIGADATGLGAPRPAILDALRTAMPDCAMMSPDGSDFALARPGRTATQIGPLVARDPATAVTLLNSALTRVPGGQILLDARDGAGLADRLQRYGFTAERPFTRMARGPLPAMHHDRLYLAAGPELG